MEILLILFSHSELLNVNLLIMKRTSKKEDYFDTIRVQNHSISSPEHIPTPIPRENTYSNFRKMKPLIQLPKIYPIHNSSNKKRYLDNVINREEMALNLVGTKYSRKFSRQKNCFEQSLTPTEFHKNRPFLEKQQSIKTRFLENILNDHGISRIRFAKNQKLKVFIDEGNNSRLVNELIRRRANLKIINNKSEANIVWTQFCDWQQANKVSVFSQISKTERQINTIHTQIGDTHSTAEHEIYPSSRRRLKDLTITKCNMHNHLKNHFEISDKKCLFKNIKKYCKNEKINEHEIIPKTYHLENSSAQLPEDICAKSQIWIVKPGEDTNRGTGITVQEGRDNIMKAVKELAEAGKSALVQQYIDPLLYKNRKFDIRSYALVTSFGGQLKAYWYKEGYLRTCCKQFNYDPSNLYGHLTNDAVQKKHKDYGKFQPYNKLSYSDLQSFLKNKDINYDGIIARMKEIAFYSIKSAEDKLRTERNVFAFQIFGFDFLIDSKGKIWLIQINTNPCLQFAGSLLSRVIWHMVENSFAIAIDPLLMQMPQSHNSWQEKVDRIYETNKFECII